MKNIKIIGKDIIDPKAIDQLVNCVGDNDIGVMTPDGHVGYAHPIGGAIAYKNHISLSGVGFDIACGNKAVKTELKLDDLFYARLPKTMDEIFKRISFGVGRPNNEPVQHDVIDKIAKSDFLPLRKLAKLAENQLGTVGSGNHFVDIFFDTQTYIWIGVHFGSRGFGHKTTTGFIAKSQGLSFEDHGKEGSSNDKPILFELGGNLADEYIYSMNLAGEYAYAGRDIVVNKVLEILGNPKVLFEVQNNHNFAWKENHFGNDYWVVRKGCTPAFPDQYGFIGANMFDSSVIIRGKNTDEAKSSLYSTVHGAGRVLSRTQAAGKKKWLFDPEIGRKVPKIISKGLVDFDAVKSNMKEHGIVLRGAGPDEAPECYKKLDEVLSYMSDSIEIVERLNPIGVAMSPSDEFDPYKD